MKIKKENIMIIIIMFMVFILGLFAGQLTIKLSTDIQMNIEKTNEAVSFFVSIVALIIALITFFSIDAVDKKNRMDNNVLEKTNYCAAYPTMIKQLNAKDKTEYKNILLSSVIKKPKIHTCMEFADWIQKIEDHIIWFAYYNWEDDEKKRFISDIKMELNRFNNINSGISLLLDENVKLIEQVVYYQENRKKNQNNNLSLLEEVRYKLLPNPIAQIVYFDYLGLDYRLYASRIMNNASEYEEFSEQYFFTFKYKKNDFNIDKCRFLIEEAKKNFLKALKLAEDDILWNGYLKYNLVRCEIMMFMISDNEKKLKMKNLIVDLLNDCVRTRTNICYIINIEGFLKKSFEKELKSASNLKENFMKYINNNKWK